VFPVYFLLYSYVLCVEMYFSTILRTSYASSLDVIEAHSSLVLPSRDNIREPIGDQGTIPPITIATSPVKLLPRYFGEKTM